MNFKLNFSVPLSVACLMSSLGLSFSSDAASASQTFGCEAVLVETVIDYKFDASLRLSLLNLIDRRAFNENRKKGGFGFSIPIAGTLVSSFSSYEKFSKARLQEFKKENFDFSKEESQTYVSSYLPEAAFAAFTECLRIKSQTQNGLHLIQKYVSNDYVSVDIFWNPPAGVGDRAVTTFNLAGGSLAGEAAQPEELKAGHYYALDFNRDGAQAFRFTIGVDGYQAERLVIPLLSLEHPIKTKDPWEIPGFRPRLNVLVHQQSFDDLTGREAQWIGIKGRSKRLEGFQVSFKENIPGLKLEYQCHLQGHGDSNWKSADEFCGTRGEKRRLEGFAMRLSGQLAPYFKVVYGCHIQSSGDISGVLGDNYCGTKGLGKRAESLSVYIERVR